MNGGTVWCSDECLLNAAVIIFYLLSTLSILCHFKNIWPNGVCQWTASLQRHLLDPLVLLGGVGWGWKANHVFVYLICISIALLSFEWFVFKHEVGPCKHTQNSFYTHSLSHSTHRCTSKLKNPKVLVLKNNKLLFSGLPGSLLSLDTRLKRTVWNMPRHIHKEGQSLVVKEIVLKNSC